VWPGSWSNNTPFSRGILNAPPPKSFNVLNSHKEQDTFSLVMGFTFSLKFLSRCVNRSLLMYPDQNNPPNFQKKQRLSVQDATSATLDTVAGPQSYLPHLCNTKDSYWLLVHHLISFLPVAFLAKLQLLQVSPEPCWTQVHPNYRCAHHLFFIHIINVHGVIFFLFYPHYRRI
jgi:hypothetical protein